MTIKKRIVAFVLLLCTLAFFTGCGKKAEVASAPSGTPVKLNILNAWEKPVKTLAISPAGKNQFGPELLGERSIEVYGLCMVDTTVPENAPILDLQVTDADGTSFIAAGLDLTDVKAGEEVQVELSLNADGTGFAVWVRWVGEE